MLQGNWKKVFAIIWAGQFLSILSSTIVNFAIILWLSIQTGSAEILAYAATAGLLPQTLIGPFSGVFVDRWNRKAVMIAADSFIALCTLLLALLFWLNIAELWHIFILLALRSVGSAFHMPAMQASIPLIAPESQLARIAGIDQMIFSIGSIAGPALGALFISIWKMEYVLLIDVVGALLACTSLLFVFIPNPQKDSKKVKNILQEMKEGFVAITEKRGLKWIFFFSIIVLFFIMPVSVLFPLITLQLFDGNAFQVSIIEIVWGVGMLLGGAIMGAKIYKINKVTLVNSMYILLGLSFLFSGILPKSGFVIFAILTTIGGIAGAVYNSAFTAIVQTKIDASMLGRVFSLFFTLSLIPSLIGLIGIGFFADNLGLKHSLIFCGSCIVLIGIIAFQIKSVMQVGKE